MRSVLFVIIAMTVNDNAFSIFNNLAISHKSMFPWSNIVSHLSHVSKPTTCFYVKTKLPRFLVVVFFFWFFPQFS